MGVYPCDGWVQWIKLEALRGEDYGGVLVYTNLLKTPKVALQLFIMFSLIFFAHYETVA